MENYLHLPPAEVRTTQAAEYMALLNTFFSALGTREESWPIMQV